MCWQPTRRTWIALAVGCCAVLTSVSLRLCAPSGALRRVLHYGLLYAGFGAAIPVFCALELENHSEISEQDEEYTTSEHRALFSSLGIWFRKTRRAWATNLAVSLCLGALIVVRVFRGSIAGISFAQCTGACLVLFVGITAESLLFCGFLHKRLDSAFGFVPAIAITAALYSLWHVGTQLPVETVSSNASGMTVLFKLFLVGVMYQSIFASANGCVFSIWPFSMLTGALVDFMGHPEMLSIISRRWLLATESLTLGVALVGLLIWRAGLARALHKA